MAKITCINLDYGQDIKGQRRSYKRIKIKELLSMEEAGAFKKRNVKKKTV